MENLKKENINIASCSDEKIYDLSILKQMDNTDYLVEVIYLFLDAAPIDLNKIEQALLEKDAIKINKTAHLLKGSAGVLGAEKLVKILSEIEIATKTGLINKDVASLLNHTRIKYLEVETALKKYISDAGFLKHG